MPYFTFEQPVLQLEPRKGGYFYLRIDASVVEQYAQKRATRLKCMIDEKVSFSCGLNHFGDGHYYIIVAGKYLKTLGKQLGSMVVFEIYEDPNPLGVEVPDVLLALLEQDEIVKKIYENLTDGKKRSLIHSIKAVKDLDKQIEKILAYLSAQRDKA